MTPQKWKTLTVGELIAQLKDLDPSLPVYSDGCDCLGRAGYVNVEDYGYPVKRPTCFVMRADEYDDKGEWVKE